MDRTRKAETQRARVERNRTIVRDYLKLTPCLDCGERDIIVLEFDHVRGEKITEVTALMKKGAAVKTLLAEIAKCDVRCANCHRRKTRRGVPGSSARPAS